MAEIKKLLDARQPDAGCRYDYRMRNSTLENKSI